MESYLRGVVPAEVPSSWPAEAVKAQAIAARSYAAYRLHPGTGTYDIYDDTRSQMYLGKLVEKAGSDNAVSATAGVVLRTPGGGIANALFHSTGGGATENNENVFTSSTGEKTAGVYSYLRGSMDRRADGSPYDGASPYATWSTQTYSLAQVQAWFAADSRTNVGTLVALDLTNRGVSGRLVSVTLIGANGSTKTVSGSVFTSVFNAHRPSSDRIMRSTLLDLSPIP
jgi:stage II sporulation protein D